ncbi:MAG: cell division protein FtsH, partial [Candidatus Omnitrophica bacterium]|nr:cell division protein FtsH [Candidatus Omnitrophota bacterium]
RHIVINAPDIKGREEILNIHLTKIRIAKNVNVHEIAKRTPGFSGADLENLSNEGALLAARRNKDAVEQTELEEAIERVLMGPEKKSRIILDKEKEITAYHEAGHAILSLLLPEVDSMAKVSIIPRGLAGGYTFMPPKEDKRYKSKKELLGEIVVALGGRVSEELNLGDITTGAMGDLAAVTDLSRRMVCDFGMSERLGNHALGNSHAPVFLGRDMLREKDYSEDTAKIVDEEVKRIVDECYARAKSIMIEHDDKVKKLAQELLEKEVLTADQVCEITGIINENSPDKNNKQEPDSSANA